VHGPNDLVWVFGYGSLMWNPGFATDGFETATLDGYHRALCVYSWHYRGTKERPGLVMGLAAGERCVGRGLGVRPEREAEILAYLDDRELPNYVYDRVRLPIRLQSGAGVDAWAYVARTGHPQYAGDLPEDEVLRYVLQGTGLTGPCADYVRNTVAHLIDIGISEPRLETIARRAEQALAASAPG
jgi:cation transport protein ChaC